MRRNERRENYPFIKRLITYLAEHANSGSILETTIFIILPAVIYGCTQVDLRTEGKASETIVHMKSFTTDDNVGNTVDILIFNNDRLARLNTYQRVPYYDSGPLKASSSAGEMIFTVFANSQRDPYDWAGIYSREQLSKVTVNLEEEKRQYASMRGESFSEAGSEIELHLQRIRAEIVLRKVSCDFISHAYSGCRIKNPKIYLINVNAETALMGDDGLARRIINTGRLDNGDIEKFIEPDIIYQELHDDIGPKPIYPGITLLCYSNKVEKESPGTPVTRLVIEGTVMEQTYYWPIDINMENNGIEGNCRYIYDIHISRPGSSDPDISMMPGEGEIIIEIEKWEEKEDYGVRY